MPNRASFIFQRDFKYVIHCTVFNIIIPFAIALAGLAVVVGGGRNLYIPKENLLNPQDCNKKKNFIH